MADGHYVDAQGNTVPGPVITRPDGTLAWTLWDAGDGKPPVPVGPNVTFAQAGATADTALLTSLKRPAGTTIQSREPEVDAKGDPTGNMRLALIGPDGQPDSVILKPDGTLAAGGEPQHTPDKPPVPAKPSVVSPGQAIQNPDGTWSVPVPAKPTTPTQNKVSPGEAVQNPDGTWSIPVPAKPDKPAAPSSTQANVDAKDAADLRHTNALTDAIETPAQAYARQVAAANAAAHAQGQAKIDEAKALVDSGITMTEEKKARLAADLQSIQSDHDATIKQAQTQYDYDLAQPQVEITNKRDQQTADAATQNAATNAATQRANALTQQQSAQQASVDTQVKALTAQAAQGQARMDTVVKAGSAVPMSMATFRMSADPLQLAFQLAHQAIATGDLPASALPTRIGAPVPAAAAAGPPSAPLPAPGVVAPTQPTAPTAAPDYAALSINDPARAA